MPYLSILMIRTSLLYLATGSTLGALLLTSKAYPTLQSSLWTYLPLHTELLLFGWLLQFSLGVAYWIFPRFGKNRPQSHLAYLSFLLLNTGVLWNCLNYLLQLHSLIPLAKTLEILAILSFLLHIWPRIKAFQHQPH